MTEVVVVFMTAANSEEAHRIASRLVEAKLAACVQILPEIESIFRWNEEVQRENEVLILAKTTAAKFTELEKSVREIHSYETPEIVAVPVSAVSQPYREWLVKNVR